MVKEFEFSSQQEQETFLFSTAFRPALGPHCPLAVKQPQYKADHSLPSSVEAKNAWNFNSISSSVFVTGINYLSTGTSLTLLQKLRTYSCEI
jgi:hypothetical protein